MSDQTYVTTSVITTDSTEIVSRVHDSQDGKIAAIHVSGYPVSLTIHLTRGSLRKLRDACLDLQQTLAERTVEECRT